MNTQQAYNIWSSQYDTNENKTRDLEAIALCENLKNISFDDCLEIGCGTGKNTSWLVEQSKHVTAVDFSKEMLAKAKAKINSDKAAFIQADITREWSFTNRQYDLITFSLVLEHIQDLYHIFAQVSKSLKNNGHVYIGELHPFKQYSGSKARFENEEGLQVVECFTHHISDFTDAAKKINLQLIDMNEYFDDNNKSSIPRILTLVFKKTE